MKKKLIPILIIIIIVLLLCIYLYKNNKHEEENTNTTENTEGNVEVDENIVNNFDGADLPTYTVKSSAENPITLDDIEITNVEIMQLNPNEVRTVATLKNNSNETLNGFYITVDLLDASGNIITSITQNSDETLEPNGESKITYFAGDVPNGDKIKSARIAQLEKNSMQNTLEENFDEMEEDVEEVIGE